jgi:hypothetical protein
MSELSQYLLESDINFYRDYAIPIIKQNQKAYDLDEFESIIYQNQNIPEGRTIKEAYNDFEQDKKAQYELNPKFGRYVM